MMSGNKIVRFLVVVFCVGSVVLGGSHGAVSSERKDSCWPVEVFLKARNVTIENVAGEIGPTCGGRCCSAHTEAALRARVRRELAALVAHSSRALHALLAATRHALHDHVMELSRQSENKTKFLFNQVYRKMAMHAQKPIASMYGDIRAYVRHNATDGDSPPQLDLAKSTMDFFTNIFPLVYYRAVNLQHKDFSEDYKACLRQVFTDLQPFGDIPKQISNSLSRSLEATRVLLQGLSLGSEVLNATDALLDEDSVKTGTTQQACDAALLKMTYCPKCQGLDVKVKPCSGYCLNVLRGCLTNSLSDLDSPWNSYVEAIERLVLAVKSHDSGVNADTVIRGLDTRISEVIMLAMENGPSLEKKVKSACGHARLSEQPATTTEAAAGAAPRLPASPLDTQLLHFLASVRGSRGFYAGLADTLCRDSAQENACWNGEGVGEYTKTVVAASASFQRYNPEVALPGEEAPDGRVARLADKLRHIRQLLSTQTSSPAAAGAADSAAFMQGDAAGEGSGSGRWSDDDDVAYDFEGSAEGSADGPEDGTGDDDQKSHTSKTVPVTDTNHAPTSRAASSSFTFSPVVLCCQILAATLITGYRTPLI